MILVIQCSSVGINNILYIIKRIMNVVVIIAPILAILSFSILMVKLMRNPEKKKLIKKLKNSTLALVILFFIPLIVNIVMNMLGESTDISSCYNTAAKISNDANYIVTKDEKAGKSVIVKKDDYEESFPKQLDFTCKSYKINANFSCETIHIIEHHIDDFNNGSFGSVIASYGGFKNYAKSIGSIFYDYYGENIKVKKVYEFQRVSEYVFGYMTMFGFDYYNGVDGMDINDVKYCKWGGSCMEMADYEKAVAEAEKKSRETGKHVEPDIQIPTGSSDAFYPGQFLMINHGTFPGASFDSGIAGNNMTTNCNNSVDMVYTKANILGTKERPYLSSQWQDQVADKKNKVISDFKDLQVGDILHFFTQPVDSSNPSTWGGWTHVAYVGEIDYENGIVTAYDGGSYLTSNRNHKWRFDRNKTTASLHGYSGWGAVRVVDLT